MVSICQPLFFDFNHLHHLIPIMINDLDGDFAGFGFGKRAENRGIQRIPRILADIRLKRFLQFFVRFIFSEKISMGYKECLTVVICIKLLKKVS